MTASTATPFSSPSAEPAATTALQLSELLVSALATRALLVRALLVSALVVIALNDRELRVSALKVSEAFAGAAAASNAPKTTALGPRRVKFTMITPFQLNALRLDRCG